MDMDILDFYQWEKLATFQSKRKKLLKFNNHILNNDFFISSNSF